MSLGPADLTKALARWSYKPGWEFRIYTHPYEGPMIAITLDVPDADDPASTRRQCVRSPVPPLNNGRLFYEWLLWRCTIIDIHEACEFGRVDGVPVVDPHSDYYATLEWT